MRNGIVLLAVAALALLGGCGEPTEIGAEPSVSVGDGSNASEGDTTLESGPVDDGVTVESDQSVSVAAENGTYRVTVTVSPPQVAYTYRDLRVTGLGPTAEPVCSAAFGDLGPDDGPATETVTCERLPMAFVTGSAGPDADPTPTGEVPDVVVDHETLVLTTTDGPETTYEVLDVTEASRGTRQRLPAGPVTYAKCVQRRDGADPGTFSGPTPWLAWERSEPVVTESYGIGVVNRTGHSVSADPVQGPIMNRSVAVSLPDDSATDPLRDLFDRAKTDAASETTFTLSDTYGRNLTESDLVRVLDPFHDREVDSLADLPVADVDSGRAAPGGEPSFLAGVRYDDRRIDCTARAQGAYVGADAVAATYAVTYDGRLFQVEAGGGVYWSGPAFNATVSAE